MKKKIKELKKTSWSGSQDGHTKKCFSTAGSVQATAELGHRQQKRGLPQGSAAAEHFVLWNYNWNILKIAVGLFRCFLFYASLSFLCGPNCNRA